MNDDWWWLMNDDWWMMIDDWLMIDDWWSMIYDRWLMIDDRWVWFKQLFWRPSQHETFTFQACFTQGSELQRVQRVCSPSTALQRHFIQFVCVWSDSCIHHTCHVHYEKDWYVCWLVFWVCLCAVLILGTVLVWLDHCVEKSAARLSKHSLSHIVCNWPLTCFDALLLMPAVRRGWSIHGGAGVDIWGQNPWHRWGGGWPVYDWTWLTLGGRFP